MSAKPEDPLIAKNRKARFNYTILEEFEAGIQLCGTEVKSIRGREVSLDEAFAVETKGEVFLHNMHVRAYSHGNRNNHEAVRIRRLLLHKREIRKLIGKLKEDGLTLVPLDLHMTRGKVKVQLGLAKGKHLADKRDTIKKRESDRDARRAMARGGD